MGGAFDGCVDLDAKSSPHETAIEKTQEELRQEYDVREERRRELEFLEKGGNPLDFQFVRPFSLSVQSTSLTGQHPEHVGKGSSPLATSPHGDSAESSGHPGTSLAQEPNFADNLLLFDGENSGTRNSTSTDKRKNTAAFVRSSKPDGSYTITRETEDSILLHLGVKNQAYARRNRSKSSRESSHLGATDLAQTSNGNREVLLSLQPEISDAKVQVCETQTDFSVSNSKATSSSKNFAAVDQLQTDLDLVEPNKEGLELKEIPECQKNSISTSEKIHGNDRNELLPSDTSEQEPSGIISASSSLVGNGEESIPNVTAQPSSDMLNHPEVIKTSCINCFSKSGVNTSSLSNEDKDTKKCRMCAETDISSSNGLEEPVVNEKDNDYKVNDNTSGVHVFLGDSNGASIKEAAAKQSTFVHGSIGNRDNGDLRSNNHDNDHKLRCPTSANAIASHAKLTSKDGFNNITVLHDKTRSPCNMDGRKIDGENLSQSEAKLASSLLSGSHQESAHTHPAAPCNLFYPNYEISDASLSQKHPRATSHLQDGSTNSSKLAKAHEDSTLREARIIQTKLKRAGELPWGTSQTARRQRSHWDYVLEEMAWLANDFMQEHIWKITAASQICRRIAVMGKAKLEKNVLGHKQREVAKILAKFVMKFWDSAEDHKDMLETKNEQTLQQPIKCYAARFLQFQSSQTEVIAAEAPRTPDRASDAVSLEMSWEEQNSDQESLFYNVPAGAMYSYRESVETYWLQYEKMGRATNQMDCEAAAGDSTSEFNVHESMEDDEAEAGTYYMHGAFEGNRPLDYAHKKRKFLQQKNCNSRSYEPGLHFQYVPGIESKVGTQQPSFVMGKKASGAHSIGPIPTKRVRTASRQRVISPFNINDSGANQVTSKTDASSGDTSSFQDDQCSLQGSLHPRKNSDFESTVDFEKATPFDGNGIPLKHKKKKKPKHLGFKSSLNVTDSGRFVASGKLQGSSYEQRWTGDSLAQEQRDYSKKRLEGHQYESSGTGGLYMQQMSKKAKILKQLAENSSEALVPLGGHVPSPIASQLSNMSNSNKLIKVLPNRDRGKKTKGLKATVSIQSGSGSPWSLLEDQTLVVLVHDMGPNWELISDAINSAVQFKCVFRKPKECKERHKILMDKSTGDGADSADDSGSSQPYPSTLPGIPKGSARQLLQCLQGPMEEDTLKAHFEKIILIGQKLHSCRVQKDNLDLKQISPDHSSHLLALSQACPNNLTGGLLTPFDLCDVTTTPPELLGYQGAPTNAIALPSYQGPVAPILPSTGGGTMLQGPPGLVVGTSFSSPSTVANASSRDAQGYGVPRPTALCADDPQRMQQYGQRNVRGSSSVGAERGVRMLPGGNGMGMMGGMSRGMPLPRPGFQGLGSPGGLNIVSSGSVLSSTGIGIPSPVNIHPGSMHGQGNSMMRPHDSLQIPRSFPQQHQQSHQMPQPPQVHGNAHPQTQGSSHTNPQQQAYNTHVAKERQLHQRLVHQQQPFAGSNSIMPLQNGSQLPQSMVSSSPVTPLSSSQPQQKQQNMSHNSQANASQMIKQRQRQQMQQQSPRQQTQQHQPAQSQTKLVKGSGRGGSTMLQNSPIEVSVANGASAIGNQTLDKHIMQQNQAKFSGGSGSNLTLPQKPNQQKVYPRLQSHTSKQMPTDSCGQGQNQISSSQALLASQQSHVSPSLPLTSQNQQRQTNQSHQPMQRVTLHQNHLNSDGHVRNADVSIQANQTIATPNTQCSDSVSKVRDVSSVPMSTSQWKHGPSYEANTQTPNARTLKQSNLVGVDSSIPVSSQGLADRQFPGSLPVHGNGTGGAWQQQQQLPLQQQQYPQHQQLHRPIGPNSVYGQPSSSRPG